MQFVSFDLLRSRLLADVRRRLNNGEFTERGLGRELGISQAQVHNVLKGARTLQPAMADLLMRRFEMSVSRLLSDSELEEEMRVRRLVR